MALAKLTVFVFVVPAIAFELVCAVFAESFAFEFAVNASAFAFVLLELAERTEL